MGLRSMGAIRRRQAGHSAPGSLLCRTMPYWYRQHRNYSVNLGCCGIREISGAARGARSSNKKVFQDVSLVSGGEGLPANLAMERLKDALGVQIHAHHFIARLALRTFELVIIDHSTSVRCLGAHIQTADPTQFPCHSKQKIACRKLRCDLRDAQP